MPRDRVCAYVTTRELATVLAALRYWQCDLAENEDGPFSEHFTEDTPLTVEEIDDLCQRFNSYPNGTTRRTPCQPLRRPCARTMKAR